MSVFCGARFHEARVAWLMKTRHEVRCLVIGKWHAAKTFVRMAVWLENWRDVWHSYREGLRLPPFHFRSGLILQHALGDDPVVHLHEVFAGADYRRHLDAACEGVFVDIGANIGAATFDWVGRRPSVTVHAYEPNPVTNRTLRVNIAANALASRVTVYDDAVGEGHGITYLSVGSNSTQVTACHRAPQGSPVLVARVGLDEVVARVEQAVGLVKIDTEGAEAEILEAASQHTLERIRQIVVECHDWLCPDSLLRCHRVLQRAGFECLVRRRRPLQALLYARRILR